MPERTPKAGCGFAIEKQRMALLHALLHALRPAGLIYRPRTILRNSFTRFFSSSLASIKLVSS
jgi:hypothetical protein